jgi:hypothetical protein
MSRALAVSLPSFAFAIGSLRRFFRHQQQQHRCITPVPCLCPRADHQDALLRFLGAKWHLPTVLPTLTAPSDRPPCREDGMWVWAKPRQPICRWLSKHGRPGFRSVLKLRRIIPSSGCRVCPGVASSESPVCANLQMSFTNCSQLPRCAEASLARTSVAAGSSSTLLQDLGLATPNQEIGTCGRSSTLLRALWTARKDWPLLARKIPRHQSQCFHASRRDQTASRTLLDTTVSRTLLDLAISRILLEQTASRTLWRPCPLGSTTPAAATMDNTVTITVHGFAMSGDGLGVVHCGGCEGGAL